MAKRELVTCSQCGKPIDIGDSYFCSDRTDDRLFCSAECMRDYIAEDDRLCKSVVEDWMETNAKEYEMESDDPYDRYGVSERDFI